MSFMGELTFFLGLKVQQKKVGIFINQDKYVVEVLKKFDFATVKTSSTPMEPNKELIKDEEADSVDVHLCRSMIGSWLYLTASMLDIMFAVCACARRGNIDKTLFIKKDKGDILLVQVYVDDIVFGSTKKSLCDEFEGLMHKRFQMSSMGELTFFLGLQVQQKKDGIFISQDKYVADILKKFDFANVKTTNTPMEPNKALIKDEEADSVDVHLYRSMIRSLMYLTASRPDITFVVCACARFQVTPKMSHLHAVKRILRYLKGQPKLGLWYPKDSPFDLEAFSDSDYAEASLNTKSTIGGCQYLGKRLISWQCKKQTIVVNSTTKAEYVAATNCCGQSENMILESLSTSKAASQFSDSKYMLLFVWQGCEPQTKSLQTETPPTVSHELQTKAHIEQILPSPSTYQRKQRKTQKHRRAKKVTELPQTSVPLDHEADAVVHKEGEIGSGDNPRRQETMGGALAQTMSKRVLEKPNEPPLSEGHTSRSGEGSMEHTFELMDTIPPTPHDSPLTGGYTPRSDMGFESSDDDLDEEDASKQGRESDQDDARKRTEKKPEKVNKKGSRERQKQEEATSAALAEEFDEIQARIDADHELAHKNFEEVQKLYEREKRWIDDFKPIDDDSQQQVEITKKRSRADSKEESSKKHKVEEDNDAEKEELRDSIVLVPRADVAIDVESLATKYPIVDWKTHILNENMIYYQIIRADGSSKNYKIFSEMLDDFDRQDLMDLHRLVQERYDTTSPEGYDLLLWGDLKTLFEPNEEDEIWKNQQDYNLISWILFDSCRVHVLLMNTGVPIKKNYPLTQEMISRILHRRLEVDYESEMAFELLRFTRSQLQK
ncbi:putative ribonuclease H-like domain-containing protein [Tanacetum coccineum]